MDHPHFTVLAHPTTRQLDKRPPMDADWLRVIRHARERGCCLEPKDVLNSRTLQELEPLLQRTM